MSTRDHQVTTFQDFAARRCGTYAPLYATFGRTAADDPEILALADEARPGISQPDLLMASVHYLLARHPEEPLAAHYPTLTDHPSPAGDPAELFRDYCTRHRDALSSLIATRLVQANEVGRCTFLRPAVAAAAQVAGNHRVALIEPGASAGLNLLMDLYSYNYGAGPTGAVSSPLQLHCQLKAGRPPDLTLGEVVFRAGVDLNPLDLRDPDDVAWLRACVWADHPHRLTRLQQALAVAQRAPGVPFVHAGDALAILPDLISQVPEDAVPVVYHSAFLAHLPEEARDAFDRLVPDLSRHRPLMWVQAEPRDDGARLRLKVCRAGTVAADHHLGDYHPHGEWLTWKGLS